MTTLGAWNLKATDWTIAYYDSDSFTVGVGFGWFGFVLASKSAQRVDSFVFHGPSVKFELNLGSIIGKLRKAEKRNKSPDPDRSFFGLKVMMPFSAYDLDYADGRVFAAMIGTDLVLRFHAERTATGTDISGYQKPAGRYFEHPAEGLPVSGQFPNGGFSGMTGIWRFVSDDWKP